MANEHILKVPRSEDEGNFVMLNIKSNGNKPLDIALLATDGDSAWASSIKQSRISKLRSKNNPIDDTEWESVLSSVLLVPLKDEHHCEPKSVEKVELTSSVAGGQMTLIVRRNVSGIIQRLGEVILRVLDEEEASERVELLDWVAVAVDRANFLEDKVENLSLKYDEQGKVIEKLSQQLEELIAAKRDHETSLLEKFQELLNVKKLKIRDQQRILAGAKSESDESMDFEKLPSEEPANADEDTPPHSDADSTEDELEDEDMDSVPPPSETVKGRTSKRQEDKVSLPRRSEHLDLPPRRELPSAEEDRPHDSPEVLAPSAPLESSHNDADGSETSDDEL
ncbi:MAG: hypothetical protein Q9195_005916 [Heterodermia aff. obscurata]